MKPNHAHHRREIAGGGHDFAFGRPSIVTEAIEALVESKTVNWPAGPALSSHVGEVPD